MLYDLLTFLPALACLFWIAICCTMTSRTSTFHPVIFLLAMATAFFYSDACYISPHATPALMLSGSIVALLAAPSFLPMVWLYLMRLRGQEHFRPAQMLWMIFPAMLGASNLLLVAMAGPERAAAFLPEMYAGTYNATNLPHDRTLAALYFVVGPAMRATIGILALIYAVLIVRLMRQENIRVRHLRKFFSGQRIRVLELQVLLILTLALVFVPKMVLLRRTLLEYPWISILLSLLLTTGVYLFCHVAMFGARNTISRKELSRGFRFDYRASDKAEAVEEMMAELVEEAEDEALKRIQSKIGHNLHIDEFQQAESPAELAPSLTAGIFSAVAKSWEDDSLLSRFENLIFGKQGYLEPGLTLTEVAEKLHTNKTYISRLVNNTYNLAFPDLINTLRVDYAEQYIIAHRDARQQEIAEACGFTSASSFNNVFKKITGMTPKIWLATYDNQPHRNASAPDFAAPADNPANS